MQYGWIFHIGGGALSYNAILTILHIWNISGERVTIIGLFRTRMDIPKRGATMTIALVANSEFRPYNLHRPTA